MNLSGGKGDKVLGDKNSEDGLQMASTEDSECQGQREPGDDLPNKCGDKLSVEHKGIKRDEPGEAIDQNDGDSDQNEKTLIKTGKSELILPEVPTKSTEKLCNLPVEMWVKILAYVKNEDLKSMRGVCVFMSTVTLPMVRTSCFIFDGKVRFDSSSLADLDEVNWDCDLTRLTLPYFRIRSVRKERIPKNYNWEKVITGNKSIVKILELTECDLHWTDVLDVLNCFQSLEEFTISFKESAELGIHFNGNLERGLGDRLVLEETSQWKSKYDDSIYPTPIPTLKTVKIELPFMQRANTVLRILERKCENLENLSIKIDPDQMHVTSLDIYVGEPRACRIETGNLLLKNAATLKKVTLNLTSESPLEYNEYFAKSFRTMGVLLSIFEIRGLALEEFVLEVPMYFLGTNPVDEHANGLREFCLAPLRGFLADQMKSLKILRLSGFGWYPGADEMFQKEIIGDAVDVYTKMLVLGGKTGNKPNWTLVKDKMDSLEIEWKGGSMKSVPAIFKGDTDAEAFEKVQSFSLCNNLIAFADFDLPFILIKFPNLTSLKIINYSKSDCFGQWDPNDPSTTRKMAPRMFNIEIHDCPFQLLLEKLPKLHTLHLDCHMQDMTDFGLTEISDKALARMKSKKCYRIESGDQIGYSLTGLKRLTSLKLIGLDKPVTNASVWLALRNLPLLKELIIIGNHKITETAKTFLKNLLEKTKDFRLEIGKPIKKPNSGTTTYTYRRRD